MVMPSSVGLPCLVDSTVAVNFSTNSSYRSSITMKRLAALHAWPQLSTRANAAFSTVASRSSVDSRMNGSEPPSSRTTFFRCRPAISATAAPARSEPVSDTPCTMGLAMMSATCSLVA